MKELSEYIKTHNVVEAEKLIKEMLEKRKDSPELWMMLARVELEYPFYDEITAFSCCEKAASISNDFLDAYFFMALIQVYSMATLDERIESKLLMLSKTSKERARLLYLKSLIVEKNDIEREKQLLQECINTYEHLVLPYVHLGDLCKEDQESKWYYHMALKNIQHVISHTDFSDYDFTDYKMYISEMADGSFISTENYKSIVEKLNRKK